jgi:hypothetical protein
MAPQQQRVLPHLACLRVDDLGGSIQSRWILQQNIRPREQTLRVNIIVVSLDT